MIKPAVFAVLALTALSARAQSPSPATLWYNAGHVELSVTSSAGEFTAAWQFDRADNGDIRIIKNEQRGANTNNGTLLSVCEDRALLFKDIVPATRREMRELDEPVLHLQLALRLLARALPQGPAAIGAEAAIDINEATTPLRVRKGSTMRRDFLVPWQVRGKVGRAAQDSIRFELAFSHAPADSAGRRDELKLSGVWQQKSQAAAFDNAFAIAEWRVYRVDTVVNFVGGNAELDPFVVPQPRRFQTLGELRSRIERVWVAGPGARKQIECRL